MSFIISIIFIPVLEESIKLEDLKPNVSSTKPKRKKKIVQQQQNDIELSTQKKRKRKERKKVFDVIYQCDLCSKKFFMKHRLEAHLRIHQGLKVLLVLFIYSLKCIQVVFIFCLLAVLLHRMWPAISKN